MGFLDNSSTTVDAILTLKGRQLLSEGKGLGIVKFALSDEEIDYTLFDVTHPNGTDSYGSVIENMNLLVSYICILFLPISLASISSIIFKASL